MPRTCGPPMRSSSSSSHSSWRGEAGPLWEPGPLSPGGAGASSGRALAFPCGRGGATLPRPWASAEVPQGAPRAVLELPGPAPSVFGTHSAPRARAQGPLHPGCVSKGGRWDGLSVRSICGSRPHGGLWAGHPLSPSQVIHSAIPGGFVWSFSAVVPGVVPFISLTVC